MDSTQQERPNINFHKYYDSIFVVTWREVYRVFLWLYKGGGQYVGDYLETTPRGKKRLGAMEKKALERKDKTSSFDISFLYHLLQHTCGLAEDTSHIWTQPQTPSERKTLEYILYLLKKKRNTLSHKPKPLMHMSSKKLEKLINKLSQLCEFMIHEAGKKANKIDEEIRVVVDEMKKALEDIKTKPIPSEYTPGKFAILAKQELQKLHQHPSPLTNTFVMPQIHSCGNTFRYDMPLKNFALWRSEDGSLPTEIILLGDAGTGKSSICKYLFDSWVFSRGEINDLQDFQLVLPVSCHQVTTRDVIQFLKELVPNTISLCGPEETRKFLETLRILWLIDGFEEATGDARGLLNEIEKQGPSSHMFITTKVQFRQELIGVLSAKNKVCECVLTGLSQEGVKHLIHNIISATENDLNTSEEKVKSFFSVTILGANVWKELENPLKASLMIKLWLEGKLSKEKGYSLSLLYGEILSARSKKLAELLKTKFNCTEQKAKDIVDKATQILCEVAFDMSLSNKFVNVDSASQKKLEEGWQSIFVTAVDWLSIFLQNELSDFNRNSFSFIHSSHQHYLTARHICYLMEQNPKPEEVLRELFEKNILSPERMISNHLYMILLQVVAKVADYKILQQPLAKAVIEILFKCKEFDPFEVVKHGAYAPAIAREVSKISKLANALWTIDDEKILAAISFLEFVMPSYLILNVSGDPQNLRELTDFVRLISKRNLLLEFHIIYQLFNETNGTSDDYLSVICSSEANCKLLVFEGKLSEAGCRYLLHMPNVKDLSLQVSSSKILDCILCNIEDLCQLDSLFLRLRVPLVIMPKYLPSIKVTSFFLELFISDKSHVDTTALVISKLHRRYGRVYITGTAMRAAEVVQFVRILQREVTVVESFIRVFDMHPWGIDGWFKVCYGPLPLTYPIDMFYDQWRNTSVSECENELGVKGLAIKVEGRLPEYVECVQTVPNKGFFVWRYQI